MAFAFAAPAAVCRNGRFNDDMATIVETNDEWIRTRTGISNRHFADKETNLLWAWKPQKRH
ncbi:MAG: hypothetical protein ACLSFT_08545 [Ruminococcus callidus]